MNLSFCMACITSSRRMYLSPSSNIALLRRITVGPRKGQVGLSRSSIYRAISQGTFPRPTQATWYEAGVVATVELKRR